MPRRKKTPPPPVEQGGEAQIIEQKLYKSEVQSGAMRVENLPPKKLPAETAKVSVTMGLTLNLGNFESARIEVGLSMPCAKADVDGAYQEAHKWVETRLTAEVADVRKQAGF